MIEAKIEKQIKQIGQEYNKINKIYLFGSRANGDFNDKSDIDLAIEATDMTNEEWVTFTFIFEDELDTLLLLDIIRLEDASEQLKEEIIRTGKVIYNN